ncbi:hypothetical protein TNCV_1926071 [Trichonephila clavipes]|nr:hypothetical protein TNCV_1926071 [Trichonephila clavipes]
MHLFGIGTDKDLQLAYHHLTNAAAKGNTYAKGYLAAYYYKRQMYGRTISLGRDLLVEQRTWCFRGVEGVAQQRGPLDLVQRDPSDFCSKRAPDCQPHLLVATQVEWNEKALRRSFRVLGLSTGCGSLVVKVDRGWHVMSSSSPVPLKDPPRIGGMHVKSVES